MRHLTWVFIVMSLPAAVLASPAVGVLQWNNQQAEILREAVLRVDPRAQVISVSIDDFASGRFPRQMSLLVVPDAHRLPAVVAEPLQGWVRSRKAVLFVSDEPPLRTWLYRAGERWVERQEALHALASWRPLWQAHPAPEQWRRSTYGELDTSWSLVDTPYGKGYRLWVSKLVGWCTYDLRVEQPFRNGETLMRFWAKGDKNTRALSIEWRERDGSRWVATVPLSEEWKQYAL
ncbi:MAG: hypothetical protein NZ749_05755, partial [bacterium]|nr:hypothetical protein [bacterium]